MIGSILFTAVILLSIHNISIGHRRFIYCKSYAVNLYPNELFYARTQPRRAITWYRRGCQDVGAILPPWINIFAAEDLMHGGMFHLGVRIGYVALEVFY